jgi:outer membrane autotransporter protein
MVSKTEIASRPMTSTSSVLKARCTSTLSTGSGGVPGANGGGGVGIVGSGLTIINSGTISGGLSGEGVTRANAITFTGGTNTLELRAGSIITGNVVAFSTADTLALGGTTNASFNVSQIGSSAQYQGFGVFQKTGSSTWTLTGSTSTVTSWAVSGGTLQAGATNVLGSSSAITVASGAVLNLAGFNQSIGSLAGAGSVTLGSATLTTGNDNTSTTFSGPISGTGGLTKTGIGALTLSGSSSYSGATAVNAGTLIVNGSIANSAVAVNSGGTLAGTGTVGATTIMSGGTFAPGNSPGTMTIAGNLAFQSGALYLVQVNPSTASSANVTAGGSATLAGTVQAAFASGSYVTRTYTIVSAAGGLNGTTFNTLSTTNLPAGFTASLSYTATNAILNLTATLGAPSAPSGAEPSPSGPGALACTFSINQCNVANALNAFFNNGGALPPNFVNIFGLTGANLANALTLLSGEAATGGQQVAFQLTNQFLGIMLDPFVDGRSDALGGKAIGFAPEREELPDDIALAYAKVLKAPPKPPSFEQRWSVWGAGYGGSNRTSGDIAVVGSHDLSARTAGGAAGLDYRLAPGTVVGFALAGGGTNWSLAQGIGGGKSDAFQAGIYGTARSGPAYLAAALAYTNHWMSTDRFAFAGDHLTASFNAQSFGGRIESGYRFMTYYGGLTPYAAIQAQNFRTPGYTETDLNGGGFALGFNSRNATDTRSELGGRFDRLLLLNPEAALTLRARVAWAHDWISDPTLAALFQTLPGASFIVNGATPAKNSALTSAGAELRLASGVTLLGKFDGEFASHSSTYAGTGTVRYTW